ncbi:MAG: excinuclease ABC subunit UvrC [Pseudomonadota bacterium]
MSLDAGLAVIRAQLKTLPGTPGVYRMVNAAGDVLYVGKARNLRQRVTSYTQPARLSDRLRRMVAQTHAMVVVTTHTEAEALLLEANLIKRYRAPYNVLLRDDKSFPHILLRRDHPWPQITKHRGARNIGGAYFGPFASASAVNRTLNALQRVFLLRSCSDSVFANRARPCLLYQIKRCSAPCVGRIGAQDYARLVADAEAFLRGQSQGIQKALAAAMQDASDRLDFETAALHRDRLHALTHIQARQDINLSGLAETDAIAIASKGGQSCVQVFFVRGGLNWGNRAYFPRHEKNAGADAILAAFIAQFYENKPLPREIVLSEAAADMALLRKALSAQAGRKVRLAVPQRGERRRLIDLAARNAREALERHLAESSTQARLLAELADAFDLDAPPQRIEIYDNSHIMGRHAVGAMVVAGPEGFMKNAYRKFNIKSSDMSPGDDFAMLREVMQRRFARLGAEAPAEAGEDWPDLILIDGGAGQLNAATGVLEELGIAGDIPLIAIAKGPERNAGREVFHRPNAAPMRLEPGSAVLYFVQRLRDEAHRFAIGSHRARRAKTMTASPLDAVPGIGAARKRALLHHFGSGRAVSAAGVEDLQKVAGISATMARAIYDHFHGD